MQFLLFQLIMHFLPDFQAYQYQEDDEMQRELRKQQDLLDQDGSVRGSPYPSGSSPVTRPGSQLHPE